MLDNLKLLGLSILHRVSVISHNIASFLHEMFPERPHRDEIDIEDDIDEPDDFNPTKSVGLRSIERNRWGLPVIEEEQV